MAEETKSDEERYGYETGLYELVEEPGKLERVGQLVTEVKVGDKIVELSHNHSNLPENLSSEQIADLMARAEEKCFKDDRNEAKKRIRDLIKGYNDLKAQDQLNTSVYNMYVNAWNELDEITDDLEYLDRDIVRFMDRYVYRINRLRQKDLKYDDR